MKMTATEITNELDVSQFADTPVIRKLAKETEKKNKKQTKQEQNARGRKRKYNTDEERLEARRIQQRAYRERKKAELAQLKTQA